MLSGVDNPQRMPYTMRTSGSLPKEFNQFNGEVIAGLGPGMNGSGGDNRVYGVGNDKFIYNIGRNTYRYPQPGRPPAPRQAIRPRPPARIATARESFNLFNHQNVTQLEPTLLHLAGQPHRLLSHPQLPHASKPTPPPSASPQHQLHQLLPQRQIQLASA